MTMVPRAVRCGVRCFSMHVHSAHVLVPSNTVEKFSVQVMRSCVLCWACVMCILCALCVSLGR